MKIYQVTQVVVYRKSISPLMLSIQASGVASTSGWTAPKLDNSADPNPADAVLEFSFDANKPGGIVLEVLTPISATLDMKPAAGADAVIVSSRTNSITVHSSEFIDIPGTGSGGGGRVTTQAIGEEGPAFPMFPPLLTTRPSLEEHYPTVPFGEGGPRVPTTSPMTDDPVFPGFTRPDPFDPWSPWGPYRGSFGNY